MLTEKQMKSLPKGQYSNTDLAVKFRNHGKKSREIMLHVDKKGNVIPNVMESKDFDHMQRMRLGRTIAKRYSK